MIIVAVCVYNRLDNIKTWIKCWKMSETTGAQLVIIHNYYGDQSQRKRYEDYCIKNGITYVPRNGPGFDIGAFQDVCRGRLEGFPDFDFLLWCCDDTLPMSKDFVQQFRQAMTTGIGIACMAISNSVIPHVRTTGFMVSKQTASKIKFPADPITTKQQCYLFEHRGGNNILTHQIRQMGLSCVMVSPNNTSPLWDVGYWKRLDRQAEHDRVFGGASQGDKVLFICPIFNMYPQILSTLICQTHKNWELLLIYNGPCDNNLPDIINQAGDSRINFIEYPEATWKWGHVLRKWALNEMANGNLTGDYVVVTNADNYYVPTFIEYMLRGFKTHTTVGVYCSSMVHSYKAWEVIPVKFERGYVDCGGVMVKGKVAAEVGWRDTETHSADWVYFSDIASKYSAKNFTPVKGCLFVHN